MIEVAVAVRAARDAVEALRSLGSGIAEARRNAKSVREAKQLLGLTEPAGEAYRCDAVHPLFLPGHIHPDNEAALSAAASDVLIRSRSTEEALHVDAAARSLLLFGSPTSEGLSRIVFGYEEVPGADGVLRQDPPLDLAYTWDLGKSAGESMIGRYVRGKGLVERPTWQIRDLRRPRGKGLTPQADADGLLSDDYLLVTRVPNFLSEDALRRGQFLVSFGGAHGTGTRAVELLLKDRRTLTAALESLKSAHVARTRRLGGLPNAYQLLLHVWDIKHRANGSVARAIEVIDAQILPDSDAVWADARRRVQPRLQRWRDDHEGGGRL